METVLGRYRSSRSILGRTGGRIKNLQFNTIHATKGQEADYVVVLDLKEGRYGFPCTVEDDPLLTIVMPPTHGDPFPAAEERRLFYVAVTRAKKAVYLITDPVRPSPFVKELIKNSPQITVRPGMRPPCPVCHEGTLIPYQSGDNLRCSNSPTCQHLSLRCPGCRRGFVSLADDRTAAECSNPICPLTATAMSQVQKRRHAPQNGTIEFLGLQQVRPNPLLHPHRKGDSPKPTTRHTSKPPHQSPQRAQIKIPFPRLAGATAAPPRPTKA